MIDKVVIDKVSLIKSISNAHVEIDHANLASQELTDLKNVHMD